jgi:hypothetical protein
MAEQCKGITKSGTQCKISRNLVDGYCHLHLNQREIREEIKEDKIESLKKPSENVEFQNSQSAQKGFEPRTDQNGMEKEIAPKSVHRFVFIAAFLVVLALIYSLFQKRS